MSEEERIELRNTIETIEAKIEENNRQIAALEVENPKQNIFNMTPSKEWEKEHVHNYEEINARRLARKRGRIADLKAENDKLLATLKILQEKVAIVERIDQISEEIINLEEEKAKLDKYDKKAIEFGQKIDAHRADIERLKNKLTELDKKIANNLTENSKVTRTTNKVNTSKCKVKNCLKSRVNAIKLALPLPIQIGIAKIANKLQERRKIRLEKRKARREMQICKINTAKARVGNFKKKTVEFFKKARDKMIDIFAPSEERKAEKRAERIQRLNELKVKLQEMKEENEELREEGRYSNIVKSRGMANYFLIFAISIITLIATLILTIISMIK